MRKLNYGKALFLIIGLLVSPSLGRADDFTLSQVGWVKRSEPINVFLLSVLRLPGMSARIQALPNIALIKTP